MLIGRCQAVVSESIRHIEDETILKTRIQDMLRTVNINEKRRDFEHLLFDSRRSEQILYFDKLILES